MGFRLQLRCPQPAAPAKASRRPYPARTAAAVRLKTIEFHARKHTGPVAIQPAAKTPPRCHNFTANPSSLAQAPAISTSSYVEHALNQQTYRLRGNPSIFVGHSFCIAPKSVTSFLKFRAPALFLSKESTLQDRHSHCAMTF